jgi:radical SAM protein with 4Fe4S-binding SPASM domain
MPVDTTRPPPQRVVWEITRRCVLACAHCLVEASPGARPNELDTAEGLDLIDQIAALGARWLTLTGGEPLVRPDWRALVARARERGLRVALSTNGHLITDRVADELVALGVEEVAVSVDGLPPTHDAMRAWAAAKRSSYDQVVAAMRRCLDRGIVVTVITSVTDHNLDDLEAVHDAMHAVGVDHWMVQLAHTTGRMGEGMLTRRRLPELVARLTALARRPDLPPIVHHTIGYLSVDEPVLRPSGRNRPSQWRFWRGSPCGAAMLGVEPDGGLKGCPNQVGAPFVVGSVRHEPLATVWNDASRWFWLKPDPRQLVGACAGCAMGRLCGGGCPCVAVAVTGHVFDDPYCVRAIQEGRS